MTKVISFSLFGTSPKYLIGAVENCRRIAKVLPGWHPIFFCGNSVPISVVEQIKELGGSVFPKTDAEDQRATLWRIEAILHPGVTMCLLRDVDSLISAREARLVSRWAESGKDLHVIRDHPEHIWHMPAGLVGLRSSSRVRSAVEGLLSEPPRSYYGVDADYLYWNIWRRWNLSRLVDDSFLETYQLESLLRGARITPDFCGRPCFDSAGTYVAPEQNRHLSIAVTVFRWFVVRKWRRALEATRVHLWRFAGGR